MEIDPMDQALIVYQAAITEAVECLQLAQDAARALGWLATAKHLRALLAQIAGVDTGTTTREKKPKETDD